MPVPRTNTYPSPTLYPSASLLPSGAQFIVAVGIPSSLRVPDGPLFPSASLYPGAALYPDPDTGPYVTPGAVAILAPSIARARGIGSPVVISFLYRRVVEVGRASTGVGPPRFGLFPGPGQRPGHSDRLIITYRRIRYPGSGVYPNAGLFPYLYEPDGHVPVQYVDAFIQMRGHGRHRVGRVSTFRKGTVTMLGAGRFAFHGVLASASDSTIRQIVSVSTTHLVAELAGPVGPVDVAHVDEFADLESGLEVVNL